MSISNLPVKVNIMIVNFYLLKKIKAKIWIIEIP